MEQNNFDIKKIKVHRTTEATVLEIVFVLMAIIVWGLIIWLVHRAPDIVPTHFDASGKPNAYGSPAGVTIPLMGITFLLIPLALAYTMLGMSSPSAIPILATVGIILVETVLFSIIIYKSK